MQYIKLSSIHEKSSGNMFSENNKKEGNIRKNIRKQPCKTCHNTSTRDIIKEVSSFYSDQENQQNIPKNITLVYPMLVSVLQAHNLELIN